MVVVPAALRRELEAHAEAEAPNEACGYLALRDGVAERFLPAENAAASPYRFDMRVREPGLVIDLEDQGYELAVFHSHPTDKAEPSRTDVANIGLYKSIDGGKSFTCFKGAPGGDDYHTVWISPDDSNVLLVAADQVIYPVMVNDQPVSSITVEKIREKWEATSFGASNIAGQS